MSSRLWILAALVAALSACSTEKKAAATAGCAADSCDMQALMKARLGPELKGGHLEDLAESLDVVASLAPAGYPEWAEMARRGAKAARAEDLEGARQSCGGCHDAYRKRYRADIASRTKPERTQETL